MSVRLSLFLILLSVGVSEISAFRTLEKDTLLLTCYNDSLTLAELDIENLVIIDNRSSPRVELSVNDFSCEDFSGVLSMKPLGNLQDFTTIFTNPVGDTIPLSDSLTALVDEVGWYSVMVTDNTNGCAVIDSIVFDNEVDSCYLIPLHSQWNNYTIFPKFLGDPFPYHTVEQTFIYFFKGDTIIQGQSYNKIYCTKERLVDYNHAENYYIGATREEGAKIFFLLNYYQEEQLLYDFDMKVGDTLLAEQLNIDYYETIKVYLQSIDTVVTQDNKTRRRYNFYCISEQRYDTINQPLTSWIEGIGNIGAGSFLNTHLNGEVYSYSSQYTPSENFGETLQCFSNNDGLIFQSEYHTNCYVSQSNISVDYTPFPRRNGIWKTLELRGDNYAPNVFGTIEQTRTYFMDGDTIINDYTYHKIYTTRAEIIPSKGAASDYIGAFRELNKVIYFQGKQTQTERILYDFNLAIGDSITTIMDDVGFDHKIFIGKIDTIQMIDNQYRKRYELRITDNLIQDSIATVSSIFSHWIEGVGDVTKGLFSFPEGVSPFTGADKFQCFSESERDIYKNPQIANCYISNSTYNVEYSPLVLENATWIMVNSREDFTINTYFAYKIQGDTVINQIEYKKVYYYELEEMSNGRYRLLNQRLAAVFREDIPNRQVYGLTFDRIPYPCYRENNTEVLIFDFDKQLGNRLNESCHALIEGFTSNLSDTITIDTILDKYGQYRRAFFTPRHGHLIEGVGFDRGLFLPPSTFVHAGYGYGLVNYCREINFNCNILTAISDPLPQKVDIFPNPTNTFIQVKLEQVFDGQIVLKSITGEAVYNADFKDTSHEILVADLPKGIYILHLQSEEGYFLQKVIIP